MRNKKQKIQNKQKNPKHQTKILKQFRNPVDFASSNYKKVTL